jgi:F-type H+-transporting ATPase subunit delta
MENQSIARRYAQALYEEAERGQGVEQVDEDVRLIQETLEGSRQLVTFFESPIVSREKKEAVVEQLFGRRLRPLTLEFLRLLVRKRREDLFPGVVRAYQALRDEQLGIMEARARAAHPLGGEEESQLVAALERLTGRRIRLRVEQDPRLIGGLVVRVGDTVYDGSVRHQLETLRERLGHGAFQLN